MGWIEAIRSLLEGTSFRQLVDGNLDPGVNEAVVSLLHEVHGQRLHLDGLMLGCVLARAEEMWGVTPQEIRAWCRRELDDDTLAPYYLVTAALAAFLPNPGIWQKPGEVERRCDDLEYDDDGLLTGSRRTPLEFTKDGILAGEYLLQYHPMLLQYNVRPTGAFLDRLLSRARTGAKVPAHFGLAVDPDLVLATEFYMPVTTKAFIRGPKGLSLLQLQDQRFPEDPSGSVTVHMRTSDDPLIAIFGRDIERFEVMWSSRDDHALGPLKTVQMEELAPIDGREWRNDSHVTNRYLHAMWSVRSERFVHLDGAVRVYDKERYLGRLETDLRRQRQPLAQADEYHKLFRLDTPLSLEDWGDLVVSYYYGNELAMEYLGGERES